MKIHVIAASIIALGLIVAGFLSGGRYTIVASQGNAIARLDRFSGTVTLCVPGAPGDGCGFILDRKN